MTIAATTGSIRISRTPSNAEDPGSLAGWSIADSRKVGTGFAETFNAAFKLRINATPPPPAPPPPATADAAVSNLGKRAVANAAAAVGGGQRQAQAFATGPQVGGYDLESVEVQIDSGDGRGLNAAIHAVSGGNPGAKLFDLARTPKKAGVLRFTAPAGATLDAETTYLVAISGSGSALSRTALGTEDPGGLDGWSIADSRRFYNGSLWSRGDQRPQDPGQRREAGHRAAGSLYPGIGRLGQPEQQNAQPALRPRNRELPSGRGQRRAAGDAAGGEAERQPDR